MADQGSKAAMQTDIDAKCTTNGAGENTGTRIRALFTNFLDTVWTPIEALLQNVSDHGTSITGLTQDVARKVRIDGTGGADILVFTGTTDVNGRLTLPDLTALTPPVTSFVLIGGARTDPTDDPYVPTIHDATLSEGIIQFTDLDGTPAIEGRSVSVAIAVTT